MKQSELFQALTAVAPTAYLAFPEESHQEPPFICYYLPGINDVYADNINYQRIWNLTIELYTESKRLDLENTIENALKSMGLAYDREEVWIDSERMYQITYYTEVIFEGEEQ